MKWQTSNMETWKYCKISCWIDIISDWLKRMIKKALVNQNIHIHPRWATRLYFVMSMWLSYLIKILIVKWFPFVIPLCRCQPPVCCCRLERDHCEDFPFHYTADSEQKISMERLDKPQLYIYTLTQKWN